MAKKKQTKKNNKKVPTVKKNTKVVKKTVKKEEPIRKMSKIKVVNKLSDETLSLIKTIVIVVVFFGLAYGLIVLLGHVGMFDKGYEPLEKETEKISYNTAIIGTVFNRPDAVYYVVFDDFSGETSNVHLNYILNSTKTETPIYKVDMSLGINSVSSSEESNSRAQTSEALKINGPTLIKIENGNNTLYLEGSDAIEDELLK